MKNVELIVRMLEGAGVRWVFGVPSGPVLPLIEALRHSDVDYVLTVSETSAGFMASTVGALTGVPGVCVATLGPGATNLATGVGAAWLDRAPVLALTCNVPTPWLDRRIQMRIDHHALFGPLTKASLALREGSVAGPLAEALAVALGEPPGPVHLDLPEDVAVAPATEAPREVPRPSAPAEMLMNSDAAGNGGPAAEIQARPSGRRPDEPGDVAAQVLRALRRSRRPILVTGLTFTRARAGRDLLSFVERQQLPFLSTLHAKGFLPESHPWWAGVIGRARRSDVQALVDGADLIVAVGYDPVEINYEEWVGGKPIVHLSTEYADAGPDVRLLLDAAGDLDSAIRALAELPPIANDWSAEELARHRQALDDALRPPSQSPPPSPTGGRGVRGRVGVGGHGLLPHEVVDVLRTWLPADGILAYDVGAHTHQVATQWRTDLPLTCLSTNGWSSMGYGMPAAYAAKMVHPQQTVVGVVGDGCFQMTVGELALARRLNLAVPIVVLNDGWLSLIKVKQERKGYGYSGINLGQRVEPPAHYFGVPCRAAHDRHELAAALDWGLSLGGPSVIEAFIDAEPYSQTVYD